MNHIDDTVLKLMREHGYHGDGLVTFRQCEQFINRVNNKFILNVDHDETHDAWYFIVRNIETRYEYRQPPCPGNDVEDAYLYGLEHILRRL